MALLGSRPLLSRSGCIFAEEFEQFKNQYGSRPLLSRSGCISEEIAEYESALNLFSSPFIEERLYLILEI